MSSWKPDQQSPQTLTSLKKAVLLHACKHEAHAAFKRRWGPQPILALWPLMLYDTGTTAYNMGTMAQNRGTTALSTGTKQATVSRPSLAWLCRSRQTAAGSICPEATWVGAVACTQGNDHSMSQS